jgi:ribosomal protein S18 acetylase RimI-like enzyme
VYGEIIRLSSPPSNVIRPATLQDVARINELNTLVFPEPEHPSTARNRILAFREGCVVIEEDAIIGYSTAERRKRITNFGFSYDARERHSPDGPYLYISDIVIHPSHQGRGLGTALLEQQEQLAMAEGCLAMTLFTRTGREYYEKHGFTLHHTHQRNCEALGDYIMNIMVKKL